MTPEIRPATLVISDLPPSSHPVPRRSSADWHEPGPWIDSLPRKSHDSCRARHPSAGGFSSARLAARHRVRRGKPSADADRYKPGYAVWLHRTDRLTSAVKNALAFRKKLAPFIEHARKAGRGAARRTGRRGCRPAGSATVRSGRGPTTTALRSPPAAGSRPASWSSTRPPGAASSAQISHSGALPGFSGAVGGVVSLGSAAGHGFGRWWCRRRWRRSGRCC